MIKFIIVDSDGIEVRRGDCQSEMLFMQADASKGERAYMITQAIADIALTLKILDGQFVPHTV